MYAEGLYVVRRSVPSANPRSGRSTVMWVLHRDWCAYLKRAKGAMPAPTVAYVGTVACRGCKPNA